MLAGGGTPKSRIVYGLMHKGKESRRRRGATVGRGKGRGLHTAPSPPSGGAAGFTLPFCFVGFRKLALVLLCLFQAIALAV